MYFNCEPRLNGLFSRNNLPKTKDRVHVINIDSKQIKGTHWVFIDINNTAVNFDCFGIEYIPQDVLNKICKDESINTTYLEYNLMILSCTDFIVSLSLNICLQQRPCKLYQFVFS